MKILDLTFSSPEENLACDDALLEAAEEGAADETLRFWSPKNYFVVLGYSNKAAVEARLDVCRKNAVPVLRRISGGGTVLQGPGCLNYSLILKIQDRRELSTIRSTNDYVMKKHGELFRNLAGDGIGIQGITDLALEQKKFSGNAQRRKKNFALFHGAFLVDFDIAKIEKFLAMPSLQPAYRQNRSHTDFLANLPLKPAEIKAGLAGIWNASGEEKFPLEGKIEQLVEKHYSREEWNFKF